MQVIVGEACVCTTNGRRITMFVQVISGEACVCASNYRRGIRLCSDELGAVTFMQVTRVEACVCASNGRRAVRLFTQRRNCEKH